MTFTLTYPPSFSSSLSSLCSHHPLIIQADWAFNQWYEKRKFEEGELACFFGGVGKLVPPKDAPSRPTSDLPSSTVAKVEKRNVLETLLFKLQMVCDTSEGPAV